ncbi:MAG: serine/threonine-protein kinase [Actinomycetota bacterium]|nr:serine/threonine-protein kinase [Actinomycetota bacterium]
MPVDTNILPPRYRGPQRIGRGGMGDIYRATDDTLGRAVAIKVLAERYSEDDAIRQRFTREALTAARLSGEPNIVTIFDVGDWNGRPFIVMEYLSGGSLDERIRHGRPTEAESMRWLEQAAAALDAAHANGVVHRDVKPGNLLLDREGNVHVADFGIASAKGLDSLTMTGTVLGTAGYLAPEQARGERATEASDRYALAVVAFELLTGRRPFEAESATAEAAAHVNAAVPSVCSKREELPCELDPVFERALAKNPAERYPSAAEFVASLRAALDEAAGHTREFRPVTPATVPVAEGRAYSTPIASGPRRRSVVPWVTAALLLAAAGGAGVVLASTLGDDERRAIKPPRARTIVKTVTTEGERERVTVTTQLPAPTTPAATTPAATADEPGTTAPPTGMRTGGIAEGRRLTDQSTSLNRQGRYGEALPIAEQALRNLQGSGDIYEAYANFNVGNALAHLGRCDEALRFIDRSQELQGYRSDFDAVRARCGEDDRKGKGKGKGKRDGDD